MKSKAKLTPSKLSKHMKAKWREYKKKIAFSFLLQANMEEGAKRYSILHAHSSKHIEWPGVSDRDKTRIIQAWANPDPRMNFDVFVPIEPYYAVTFMSKIRKMLYKLTAGRDRVIDIKPFIRPNEDEKLGILIKYSDL